MVARVMPEQVVSLGGGGLTSLDNTLYSPDSRITAEIPGDPRALGDPYPSLSLAFCFLGGVLSTLQL